MSKGICFINPMFNKVVTGEKIQTRRIITDLESLNKPTIKIELSDNNSFAHFISENKGESMAGIVSRYKVGETIYLKEPYSIIADYEKGIIVKYKFDYPQSFNYKWSNKLFMPASAARHFIKITAVRAERLQDISEEDCLKEGIEAFTKDEKLFKYGLDGWEWSEMPRTAREAYAALIDKINGKGVWERNPFVWVYDFKFIK